ncbi:MAG: hypothetical protein JW925_10160 [Syntrophaceae bacterium]|nr:hypothetical protein [Syntrophaceae bacterium]
MVQRSRLIQPCLSRHSSSATSVYLNERVNTFLQLIFQLNQQNPRHHPSGRSCCLAVGVMGEAGVGKTRELVVGVLRKAPGDLEIAGPVPEGIVGICLIRPPCPWNSGR